MPLGVPPVLAEAVLCAALVVYHEARGEPYVGREAAAHVVLNRARNNGTTVCWETFRREQFSWTTYPEKLESLPKGKQWKDALTTATRVIKGGAPDFTGGATHFDRIGLKPCWVDSMKIIAVWGNHIFYRLKPGKVYTTCSRPKKAKR